MNPFRLRDLIGGLAVATLALATVLCGFTLALGEGGQLVLQQPAIVAQVTQPTPTVPSLAPTRTAESQPEQQPEPTQPPPTDPPTATATLAPTHTATNHPTATDAPTDSPTAAPPTQTTGPSPSPTCGPPPQWGSSNHIVQSGENLFRIALRYNTTVTVLRTANCLPNANIVTGQRLAVPPVSVTNTSQPSQTAPTATAATGAGTIHPPLTLPRVVYDNCTYVDTNGDGTAEDYSCLAVLTISDGEPPWTVVIDGAGNPGPFVFSATDDKFFYILGRRCADTFYTVIVSDNRGAVARLPTGLLASQLRIFPPGSANCSLP